jgi:hypothetical protein
LSFENSTWFEIQAFLFEKVSKYFWVSSMSWKEVVLVFWKRFWPHFLEKSCARKPNYTKRPKNLS